MSKISLSLRDSQPRCAGAIRLEFGVETFQMTVHDNYKFYGALLNVMAHFRDVWGVTLPEIDLQFRRSLPENGYRLSVGRQLKAEGMLKPGQWLALGDEDVLAKVMGEPTEDPVYGLPARWILPAFVGQAARRGLFLQESETILATVLIHHLTPLLGDLMTPAAVSHRLEQLRGNEPQLVDLALAQIGLAQLHWILRELLKEEVAIFELDRILLGALGAKPKSRSNRLAEARVALSESLSEPYRDEEGTIGVIVLARWVERLAKKELADDVTDDWFVRRFGEVLQEAMADSWEAGYRPVLLVDHDLRRDLQLLFARSYPQSQLSVLSFNELGSSSVVVVATIGEKIHPLVRSWPQKHFQQST